MGKYILYNVGMKKEMSKLRKDELFTLAQVFVGSMMSDLDFLVSYMQEDIQIGDDLYALYRNVGFFKELMSDDERSLYKKVLSCPEKMTKEELARSIETILDDRGKLEGFMIAFTGSDQDLLSLFAAIGHTDEYEAIQKDKVYRKRREYINTIATAAKAAANLYGVIGIEDVYDIIDYYDLIKIQDHGYQRRSGPYRKTIFACSKYYSPDILHIYIELMGARINFTNDGLLLDQCFADEFDVEFQDLVDRYKDGVIDNESYNKLLDEYDSRFSYRRFHIESLIKPLWLPQEADDFLAYSSGMAVEESEAADELFDYIDEHFSKHIKLPDGIEASKQMMLDLVEYDIVEYAMQLVSDHNKDIRVDLDAAYDSLIQYLHGYGIRIKKDEKYDLRLIMASLHDEVRLWQNRGFTNKELEQGALTDRLHPSDIEIYLNELLGHKMEDFSGDEEVVTDPATGQQIIKVKRATRSDLVKKH